MKMETDYIMADDKRFSFLMVPWALVTEPGYQELSMESRILYSLMLDRMQLSVKNRWLDDCDRVFIYYNSTSKIQPSAFESEIPPLHKSAIYDKRVFRPPGARRREEAMTWQDIPLYWNITQVI